MPRSAAILDRVDAYTLWAFNPPRLRRPEADAPQQADVVDTVAQLLTAERERIRALDDPAHTLREIEQLRRRVAACLDDLEAEGPQDVRSLRRRGWSFARIAEETGLTTRRVAELARATHRRR